MGGPDDQLLISALAAFSDGCTIPKLTPTCPYYRWVDGRATCSEECRALLTSMGVDRQAREMLVLDGLRMIGTPVPMEVATGYQPYDATRQLLEEQGHPVALRATSTLLLQFRSHAVEPPGMRGHSDSYFYDLWGELARRGLPVESVLRAAIAPAMAKAVVRLLRAEMAYNLPEWQKAYKAGQAASGFVGEAYCRWFADRVTEWFARLLEGDSEGFLSWKASPAPLLFNLPGQAGDDEGRWVWERFIRSHVEDWSTSSLILEWKHIEGNGEQGTLTSRALNARTLDPDRVSSVVMSRLAGAHKQTQHPRDLSADHFIERASHLLKAGRPQEAADIFAALVVVHPSDSDALNNLGFCLFPTDPRAGAKVLDRASTFPSTKTAINTANRAFAQHLLGDNENALIMLAQAKAQPDPGPVMMWVETQCGEFTLRNLGSIAEYVEHLSNHIEESRKPPEIVGDDSGVG